MADKRGRYGPADFGELGFSYVPWGNGISVACPGGCGDRSPHYYYISYLS